MKKITYYVFNFSLIILVLFTAILLIEKTTDTITTAFVGNEIKRLKDKAVIGSKFTSAFVHDEFDALIAMESPEFIAAPMEKQQELLDVISISGPGKYIDLILVAPSGQTVWSQSGKALKNYSENLLFQRAKNNLSTYMIEHVAGLPPIYLVVKPILKEGNLQSVVFVRMNLAKLALIIRNLALPYDNIFVADADDIVISDTMGLAASKPSIKVPWDIISSSEDTGFDASCDTCLETLSRSAAVSTLGWKVYVTVNQAPFYAKLTSAMRWSIWIIGIWMALGGFALAAVTKDRWSRLYEWGHRPRKRIFFRHRKP